MWRLNVLRDSPVREARGVDESGCEECSVLAPGESESFTNRRSWSKAKAEWAAVNAREEVKEMYINIDRENSVRLRIEKHKVCSNQEAQNDEQHE